MGREVSVARLEMVSDTNGIIRDFDACGGGWIGGRTEFTNALFTPFLNRKVEYLIVDYEGNVPCTLVVEDQTKYAEERRYAIEAASISYKDLEELCLEYIEKDNKMMQEVQDRLEDARKARARAMTLQIFHDFSEHIQECQDYLDNFKTEAQSFFEDLQEVRQGIAKFGDPNRAYALVHFED